VSGAAVAPRLRPASTGDEAALAVLDSLVNPSAWTAAQFNGACTSTAAERAIVAAADARLLGFVVYSLVVDEACIHNIAVQPDCQRQGLGLELLRAALSACSAAGAKRCYLEVRASNRQARRLYEKLEFKPDGVRKNYYSSEAGREDALLMSRELSRSVG
jgi:ribosomal-protein-alanine N-acetyltransferase